MKLSEYGEDYGTQVEWKDYWRLFKMFPSKFFSGLFIFYTMAAVAAQLGISYWLSAWIYASDQKKQKYPIIHIGLICLYALLIDRRDNVFFD